MNGSYQDKWESRSSIRTRARKLIDFNTPGDFFPEDKQVLFLLPEAKKFTKKNRNDILILSFYKYLQDIIELESNWVYAACNSIVYKDLQVSFTQEMKMNAISVIIDEYYHVYLAYDYMQQLQAEYKDLLECQDTFSDSYHAMITIKDRLDEEYRDIFEIIAVCIFETTLIKELVTYFDAPNIHPTIKYYINDHMNDESRHYVYFYDLLNYIWGELPTNAQDAIGTHLGDFVTLYLNIEGERRFNKELLAWLINSDSEANILVDKLYEGFTITKDIPIVKNVLNVLTNSKILLNKAVQANFRKNNLY